MLARANNHLFGGKSLKNLGVETIDLMQFHTWEDRWLNDERLPHFH